MTAFDKAWSLLKNENMGLDREEGGPYMRTPSTRSALADIYGRKEGTVGGPENFGVAPPFNPFHPTYRFNPLTRGDAGGLIHPSKIDPRVRGFAEESAKLVNNPLVKPMQPESQTDREEFQRLFKEEITDMVEYPPGSGNFVTQQQAQIMQIQERNRQARQAMEENAARRARLIRYD